MAVPIYCNTLGHIWLQFNFKFDTELEVEQTQDTDEVATLEMNDFVIMPDNKVWTLTDGMWDKPWNDDLNELW